MQQCCFAILEIGTLELLFSAYFVGSSKRAMDLNLNL